MFTRERTEGGEGKALRLLLLWERVTIFVFASSEARASAISSCLDVRRGGERERDADGVDCFWIWIWEMGGVLFRK